MTKTIKNFSKKDSMKTFRIISTVFLGGLCAYLTYIGIDFTISNPGMPIIFYVGAFFGTMVTLSCMLVGIFVEEDARPESEYIKWMSGQNGSLYKDDVEEEDEE